MSAATNEMAAGIETEAGGKITPESEKLQGEGTEEIRSPPPTSKLSVLRAAIFMSAVNYGEVYGGVLRAHGSEPARAAMSAV